MQINSPTKSIQVLAQELDSLNKEIYQGETEINKELGLYPPKGLSPALTKIWQSFFQLIRKMYDWDLFYKEHVKKFLFDFFEIGKKINGQKTTESEEIKIKQLKLDELWANVNERVGDKKLMLEMLYLDNMNQFIEDYYNQLESEEEKVEFLKMIYNGSLPPEIQATIDQNNAPQFTPEEIEQMQRKAVADATSKYQGKHGLNLGQIGTVLTAAQIAEFVDADGDGENDLEETLPKPEIKKIKTLPDLPNNSDMSIPKNNISDFNASSQNNSQNTNQNSQINLDGQQSMSNQNSIQNFPRNNTVSQNNSQNSVQNINSNPQSAEFVPDFGNNKFTRFRNPPSS